MKRACVFMANGTEECEALLTVDILRRAGVEIVTASVNQKPEILSSHNVRMDTDAVAADIQAHGFDLIVLPGGMPGTTNLKENEFVKAVCQQAAATGKLVAAICAAPSALAAFGLLEGKKATAYPSFTDQLAGATVVKEPVVEDGALLDTFEASSQFQWLSFDDLGNSSPSVDHVDFLNQMPNLTYLDIEVAPGTDLTLLEQKESLVSLNLYTQGNMTLDISQLKHLEEIRVVSIDGTALLEVNNTLPSLRLLEFHDYDGDGVAFSPSLDTITNLPNLEYLSMDTAGADLTPLSTLSKLRAISLDGVSRPLDLTPLTQCPNLEAYKLYGRGPDEGLVIPPELKTENAAGQTAQDIQFEISSDIMDRSLT